MPSTETISVAMPPEMMRVIREAVEAGEYGSTGEALREAVRVWQRQRQGQADRLDTIRARIRRSLDDPRPSLSQEELDAHLESLFERSEKSEADAAT